MIKLLKKKKKEEICIVKCGVTSPLGIDSKMTAAMIMAECMSFTPHDILTDPSDLPIKQSKADYIENEDLIERFKELLVPALSEVLVPLHGLDSKLRIYTGLPEKDDTYPENLGKEVLSEIKKMAKEITASAEIDIYCKGHSSNLICIEKSISELLNDNNDFCIVGGVDSYIEINKIFNLHLGNRIHCSTTKHGFVPGEAAGFLLLTTKSRAEFYNLPIVATIKSVHSTMEEKTFLSGNTCLGQGLSEAVYKALKELPKDTKIDKIYCDLNGERFRTEEYNYLISRNPGMVKDPGSYISTAKNYGDVGAATFPGLVNLAALQTEEKTTGLFFTASDSGIRSAAVLEMEPIE